jgi:hypothetical protein
MFDWLRRRRESIQSHEKLWAPERVTGSDGLSVFQRRAEDALLAAGYGLRQREVRQLSGGEPTDLFITGLTGRVNARVYLYQDGIELRADNKVLRFEDWDSEGPDDMVRILRDALRELDARAG